MQQWMAIYTKPRSEKKVAERLSSKGYEVYCPLQTTIKQWSDRKKKVSTPIFPSYVFINIEASDRVDVLQDAGVLNFVFYLGKPAVIKPEEIETIKIFLGELNDKEYSLELDNYRKGDKVDIIAGPFAGVEGIIEDVERKTIKILVESLGTIIKVEINKHHII